VKLLRVLETNQVVPVGGKSKSIDVRIISASHQNLAERIQIGAFRADLFYRLVQAEFVLPPLRERNTDIILLAKHFIAEFGIEYHEPKSLTPNAEKKLINYSWQGNIRQLRNTVRMAFINATAEQINAEDIILQDSIAPSSNITIPPEGIDLDHQVIPSYYQAALKITNGNAAKAARLLGLEPHTFRARLRNCGKKNDASK
jgi:two-component system nitrogen regulation response regulator GlnG